MLDKTFTAIITFLLSAIIFWLFRKYFPIIKSKNQTAKTFSELRQEFQRKDILFLLCFFLLIPVITYIFSLFFDWISDFYFSPVKDDGFLFFSGGKMWFIPSLFAGLSISAFITLQLQKTVFKNRFNDYLAYSNIKYGLDFDSSIKILMKVLIIFVAIFFILGINNFAHFGNDKITISYFLDYGRNNYEYKEINSVKLVDKLIAPNGDVVSDKHFIIDFSNSNYWSSRQAGASNYEQDKKMIEFVLKKSNHKLISLEFNEN